MGAPLLISFESHASGRKAVVAEERDSVWLYLTTPGALRPERDYWLLNTPHAPEAPDLAAYRGSAGPPPAPRADIEPSGVRESPSAERWEVRWADDGDAVIVLLDGLAIGLCAMSLDRGVTRFLRRPGAWGMPWDPAVVSAIISLG